MEAEEVKICPECGEATEMLIDFPLFDGSGRTEKKKVNRMCLCRRKQREAEDLRREREEILRRIESLKKLSLIDDKLKDVTFSTYRVSDENKKLFKTAQRYVERFDEMFEKNQGLLLYGDVGTGKSYTAAAIANELINRLHPVIMTSFVKLLSDTFGMDVDTSEYLNRLNMAQLLIIDDLGAERGTDYALERVYDIVDSRYRCNKPVIITTNLTMEQMRECRDIRYTRIYDRLFEMCYPIIVKGQSWRKKDAAARYRDMKKLLEG